MAESIEERSLIMLAATTPDIKTFMNHFLTGTEFDRFLLCEATIMTGSTYIIDGHINKDFYDSDDEHLESDHIYQYWEECRPIAFQMIKGSRTPLAMKVVLMLAPYNVERFLEKYNLPFSKDQITGLYLNLRYEHQVLTISSGTALTVFTLDKSVERMWEEMLRRFFEQQGIALITS